MIIMMTMMMMIIIIYNKTDSSEAINRQRPTKSQQQLLTKKKHDQKNGHLYMANRFAIIYLLYMYRRMTEPILFLKQILSSFLVVIPS